MQQDKRFQHIKYDEKIARAMIELTETDPKKIIKRGREPRDRMLWGIYWGKLIVVGADTGVWKTTFVNQICNNVSKQGRKVVKYSLEDRMEDAWKEELFYLINRKRIAESKKPYNRVDFVNNEYWDSEEFKREVVEVWNKLMEIDIMELDKNWLINIDDLVKLMKEQIQEWVKLFAIDHLHYFEMDWNERHDLQIQNAMHKINELARKHNVAIILVAHYKLNKAFWQTGIPSYDDFKDWAAIKQVANIIIQITREIDWENESQFHITKLRWPIRPEIINATFDLKTFEYKFYLDSDKQTSMKGSF